MIKLHFIVSWKSISQEFSPPLITVSFFEILLHVKVLSKSDYRVDDNQRGARRDYQKKMLNYRYLFGKSIFR